MKQAACTFNLPQRKTVGLMLAAVVLSFSGAAHALFEDGDARRAILELRTKVEQLQQQDQSTSAEIQQLRSSLLELQSQISSLNTEVASLRGEKEQLQREVQQYQQGVDSRLQKFEPLSVEADGVTFTAQPVEQQAYEAALDLLRQGEFEKSRDAFTSFMRQYPQSGYQNSARFWLGNALYATRQYQPAIDNFNALLRAAPKHARAPEAALSIANSQVELKNVPAARKTLENLITVYPDSEAAATAKERLSRLR